MVNLSSILSPSTTATLRPLREKLSMRLTTSSKNLPQLASLPEMSGGPAPGGIHASARACTIAYSSGCSAIRPSPGAWFHQRSTPASATTPAPTVTAPIATSTLRRVIATIVFSDRPPYHAVRAAAI